MVQYTYLGQCGFLLDFDGTRIMTDPHFSSYGPDDMRSYPPPCTLMDAAPEAVLISHSHVDHLDPKTIAPYVAAGGQAAFYAPAPECRLLQELGVANWRAARAEQPFSVGPVTVTPIPCAHMELHPDEHGDYHELSYLLSGCGKTVFFGGDMSLYPGLLERLQRQPIDLLLLPVNGWDTERLSQGIIGNIDHRQAAQLAAQLGAPFCPMHHDVYAFNGCPIGQVAAAAEEYGAVLRPAALSVPQPV